jgi:hypothetical protein
LPRLAEHTPQHGLEGPERHRFEIGVEGDLIGPALSDAGSADRPAVAKRAGAEARGCWKT